MQIDLKELFATLAVGIFFIFGFEFIILNFFGKSFFIEIFKDAEKETHKYVIAGVMLTLCFIFGMVMEDISNKFVDEDHYLAKRGIITPDDNLKFEVFFGEDIHNSDTEDFVKKLKESDFVQKAARHDLLRRFGEKESIEFENYIESLWTNPQNQTFEKYLDQQYKDENAFNKATAEDKLKNVVLKFYYNAKSEVYQNQSYYDELKRIQQRIDFSRAMVAISFFLMNVIVLILLFKIMLILVIIILKSTSLKIRYKKAGYKILLIGILKDAGKDKETLKRLTDFQETVFTTPNVRWVRLAVAMAILFAIFCIANFAYSTEEKQFNKRTFGYYLASKINAADKTDVKSRIGEYPLGTEKGKITTVGNIGDDEFVNITEKSQPDSFVVSTVFKNDKVIVLEKGAEWSKVRRDDKIGYIPSKYLLSN